MIISHVIIMDSSGRQFKNLKIVYAMMYLNYKISYRWAVSWAIIGKLLKFPKSVTDIDGTYLMSFTLYSWYPDVGYRREEPIIISNKVIITQCMNNNNFFYFTPLANITYLRV